MASTSPPLDEDNALSCSFRNGARVVSLPGDEATVRGYSAPRLIVEDEASRVPDELYRAIRPMLATAAAGRLVLMSTPFGRRGHFWEEWDQGGEDWEWITVPAREVPRIRADCGSICGTITAEAEPAAGVLGGDRAERWAERDIERFARAGALSPQPGLELGPSTALLSSCSIGFKSGEYGGR